jgi:small subunit ribosomal protein S2e
MSEEAGRGEGRGGFGRGRGRGRGDGEGRGRGRGGRGRGGEGRGGGGRDENVWVPVTKLGRLVKEGKIMSIEEIFLYSLPVKEAEIIDYFLKDKLHDEVMKIMPVQKQSSAGQCTRFKAFVAIGDSAGHVGLGVKCSMEVATAIRGAITAAKLNVAPVRRGFWGRTAGMPHTVPCKVTGQCGSCRVRLIPAPRGTGLVASPAGKKLLHMAGIDDCYTSARGHTRTMGNFIMAIFYALRNTYGYLSPELWKENVLTPLPYQEHTDFLSKKQAR